MRRVGFLRKIVFLLVAVGISSFPSSGQVQSRPSDIVFVRSVFDKLVAVTTKSRPATLAQWPPNIEILNEPDANAFAYLEPKTCAPQVRVTPSLLSEVIQSQPDRLAFILGHELAHITLGHVKCVNPPPGSPLVIAATTRDQEYAADITGMNYALAAGFTRNGLVAYRRLDELFGYSSFEALRLDHPSSKDRLARMDAAQASLWRAMSAFENGVYLLVIEHYDLAEQSFRAVTLAFPDSYEAWANLGYAQLMRYADSLSAEDVRSFKVGQIMVGGFYERSGSLQAKVRGIDAELWSEAVRSLTEANRLNPNLTLVKANLGVAELVRPRDRDFARAIGFLEAAARQSLTDRSVSAPARLSIFSNLTVAYSAAGWKEEAADAFDGAIELSREVRTLPDQMWVPLVFNSATMLSSSTNRNDRMNGFKEVTRYLSTASRSSAWWPLAYENYTRLCTEFAVEPKPADSFSRGDGPLRPVTSVQLAPGGAVTLGEPMRDVRTRLGAGEEFPLVSGLVRVKYPARGIDLIGGDQILAVVAYGPAAPPVRIRATGTGSRSNDIRVGMRRQDLDRLLGNSEAELATITEPGVAYEFYSEVGLAVRFRTGGIIDELVIAQLPR
jgi:tetratricopeptide (TPR) repeat protein